MDRQSNQSAHKVTDTFWSLDEFAEFAGKPEHRDMHCDNRGSDADRSESWFGHASFNECLNMARYGWSDELDHALTMAEDVIKLCDQETELSTFQPVWDVSGAVVDIGRAVTGEPEDMIDFLPAPTSRVGKVITLCASLNASSMVTTDQMKQRGYVIVALAMALTRLGHNVEMWADISGQNSRSENARYRHSSRVLVKGANDTLDPARVMFAFAHPGMVRALGHSIRWGLESSELKEALGVGGGGATPVDAKQDMPEGTIYAPSAYYGISPADAARDLRGHLKGIGLIAE